MLRHERSRIGAQAEEGGVPERDDPGIAEDEVERERKQRKPCNLGQDQVVAGQQEDRRERRQPE